MFCIFVSMCYVCVVYVFCMCVIYVVCMFCVCACMCIVYRGIYIITLTEKRGHNLRNSQEWFMKEVGGRKWKGKMKSVYFQNQ